MHDEIIVEPIEFEWDEGNKEKNYNKHGIKNEESEMVFFDEQSVLSLDSKHSTRERRYQIIGRSELGNALSVIFTLRDRKVRIISARRVNHKEKKFYESKKTEVHTNI